jgi:hypothetical protein
LAPVSFSIAELRLTALSGNEIFGPGAGVAMAADVAVVPGSDVHPLASDSLSLGTRHIRPRGATPKHGRLHTARVIFAVATIAERRVR